MEIEILVGIIGVMFQVNRLVTIYSGAAILSSIDTTTKDPSNLFMIQYGRPFLGCFFFKI